MSNPFNINHQKSVTKTFNPEDDLSDDGLIWFNDVLQQLTKRNGVELNPKQKFRITIKKL